MEVDPTGDTKSFREALGCFVTGVTVVTCLDSADNPVGATASSFNSVSLDPPLILFSLGNHMRSLCAYEASKYFAVNVLCLEQEDISKQFASQEVQDKWEGVRHSVSNLRCPLIEDSMATFECESWKKYDGGDHIIFVGRVIRAQRVDADDPLLFYRGKLCSFNVLG